MFVVNAITLALGILHGWFKPSWAGAGTYRNHPLAIPIAIKLQWHGNFQGIGDASSWRNDQGSCLSASCRLWENGKVGNGGGALFVEDPNWDEWHASTKVLKGKVEPGFGQWPKTSDFCVYTPGLQDGKARIWGDSVHLHVGVLHPERAGGSGWVRVRLVVEKVECLFARPWDVRDAVAVSDCEFHFHIYAQHVLSWDKVTAKPVVLVELTHVADLVCPDGVHSVIVATHLFPLKSK